MFRVSGGTSNLYSVREIDDSFYSIFMVARFRSSAPWDAAPSAVCRAIESIHGLCFQVDSMDTGEALCRPFVTAHAYLSVHYISEEFDQSSKLEDIISATTLIIVSENVRLGGNLL